MEIDIYTTEKEYDSALFCVLTSNVEGSRRREQVE